jgi:aminopeptidase N
VFSWLICPTAAAAIPFDPPVVRRPLAVDQTREGDPRYRMYDLRHVELRIRFDLAARHIAGLAAFDLVSRQDPLFEILLDLADTLDVVSVTRDGHPIPFRHAQGRLIVRPDLPVAAGESTRVVVQYEGYPQPDGFLGLAFETHGDPEHGFPPQALISTLSETNSAPAWWPCKDVTSDRFRIDSFFTMPDSLTAVSNGTLAGVTQEPDGSRTWHWRERHPIATYLVSLAATNYVSWTDTYHALDGSTMPVVYYAYPENEQAARTDWARTPEMISHFASLFGEYPFLDEKYGMAEFNWGGAMENQTITSYGAYFLLYDQESNEITVSHELAHQWWGDAVTPSGWDQIWLNEGFATYGEALWREHVAGAAGYRTYMQGLSSDYFEGPLVPPDYEFSATTYFKGAWVLHMLRGVLGTEPFFRGLREYRRDFSGRPAETEGLRRSLENACGRPLQGFFRSWVYGSGMPFYDVSLVDEIPDGDAGRFGVLVRQTQPEEVFAMPVQLAFVFEDAPAETVVVQDSLREQTFSFAFPARPSQVVFDPAGWILKHLTVSGREIATGVEPQTLPERAGTWTLAPSRPNPSAGPVEALLRAPEGANGPAPRFLVADAAGRVLSLLQPALTRQGWTLRWNGCDPEGRPAPGGVYWIRPLDSGPDSPAPVRVVRIR